MSFDQPDGHPLVNVHKRTTKVNIWIVIGVITFFLIGICAAIGLA